MFKLESYITPILLSYVDKYIKNFRPEDSQVSLWGGDASFHNLDLRLDVLEEELQLPFNLVSGHIHELLIHVPWTKLASEPINITINTIECVLKLRGSETANTDGQNVTKENVNKRKSPQAKRQEIATPPGYVQSLINKIVNNITINCNNLILKYVEEDIVVSVNIKLLTFQSADSNWQAAYTDISPSQMLMRKLITLSDLTVCLDKRNAAGKIEIYQEPVLYRCSVEMRFSRQFHSSTAEKALSTRLDIYCNRMEFSMTEQQIPMLMRIINLLIALHQRQIKDENGDAASGTHGADDGIMSDVKKNETWTGWAWSFAAVIFPGEEESAMEKNIIKNQTLSKSTFQLGVYIDHAIFTFKVSEYFSNDRGYYASRKVKYWPLLCLQLNGFYIDSVIYGVEWTSVRMGIAEAFLLPMGCCSCGLCDVGDNIEESQQYYLKTGCYNGNHKMSSLFDPQGHNDKARKNFTISWDYYINTVTESVLMEKTSAFAIDFLYHLEIPTDFNSEKLSELGSDLEYSNLVERSICRIVGGPLVIHVCSGLIHRTNTLLEVMNSYDYPPYTVEVPLPELNELHPPTEDDFDALNNSIPTRIYQITFLKPVIQFQLMDHPKFISKKGDLFRRMKKNSTTNFFYSKSTFATCPYITLESETIDIKIVIPIYPKRLVYTTCQLPEPPTEMFNACYNRLNIKISGFSSQMIFSPNKKTTILLPLNIKSTYESIIFPKYWINPEIMHNELNVDIDSITMTATKAKVMVIIHIIEKFLQLDAGEFKNSIFASTLLQDAIRDSGMVVLELYGEQLNWKRIYTMSTECHKISLDSLKAFVLEPSNDSNNSQDQIFKEKKSFTEPNQAMIISAPEYSDLKNNYTIEKDSTLFTATIQFSRNPEKIIHPPLIFFNVGEIKVCVDPLLFQWFFYSPKTVSVKRDAMWSTAETLPTYKPRAISDVSGSNLQDTPRRANTPHESIHSISSEKEITVPSTSTRPKSLEQEMHSQSNEPSYYEQLKKWYPVWTNLIFFGDMTPCTIYFPTQSLSAVGAQGIEDAIEMSFQNNTNIEIMVIKLPSTSIRTAGQRQSLSRYTSHLPVTLPSSLWTTDKQSFPWSIEIKNFCCYTLQNKTKLYFIKPISGNITMGLSIKYKTSQEELKTAEIEPVTESKKGKRKSKTPNPQKYEKNIDKRVTFETKPIDNINSVSIYVHIDNTPIELAFSEIQVCLISSIFNALLEAIQRSTMVSEKKKYSSDLPTNFLRKSQSRSQSPTFFKEELHDTTISERTPTSPPTEVKSSEDDLSNDIKFTVWMQWTITRVRMKLYGYNMYKIPTQFSYLMPPNLKLVVEMEDIMTSLDLQQIYSKFKLKVVTASILHYKRDTQNENWKTGSYLGTIMRSREEIPGNEKQDDFGFLSITITKAKCGHVHNKWGASKKHRLAEMKMDHQIEGSAETRCISEVVATVQSIDFIFSAKVLKNFYMVLEPILNISIKSSDPKPKTKMDTMACLNNTTLPLAYLDCNGIRIAIISVDLHVKKGYHDICIIEIENINLIPTAENPICRNPVRPDIYQHAAQNRILNIPGSDIEDRQYQLNLKGFSVNSGLWAEFSQLLCRDSSVINSLHTMNENPALEWNNLEWGKNSLVPHLSLLPIIQKFNHCIVMAPSILCRNVLVCGCSIELNFESDIDIFISLQQFRLISALQTEFMCFTSTEKIEIIEKRPKFTYFNQTDTSFIEETVSEYARDSGNDTMDVNSEITSKTKETYNQSTSKEPDRKIILKPANESKSSEISQCMKCSTGILSNTHNSECPLEILITGGDITISLYKFTDGKIIPTRNYQNSVRNDTGYESSHHESRKTTDTAGRSTKEDTGYEASEEESISIDEFIDIPVPLQKVQPLLFILMSQPNLFISQFAFEQKINVSCFDIHIKTSEKTNFIEGLPTRKDYKIFIMESKPGIPNKDTGIPPAFITLKWAKMIGKPPILDFDFGRPVRLFHSYEKMEHFYYLKDHFAQNFYNACNELSINSNKSDNKSLSQKSINFDSFTKYRKIKSTFLGIQNINLNLSQFVFVFITKINTEMTFSFEKIESHLSFLTRPERISLAILLKNIAISTNIEESKRFLLNPWSFKLKVSLFWESWQNINSDPQIKLAVESDCLNVDVGPEQVKCLETTSEEVQELLNLLVSSPSNNEEGIEPQVYTLEKEQYYKDDLRAGAFQFVDATGDPNELPLPYQVMFWNFSTAAMAWRYPQPRILTKVRVFPVPFKLNSEESDNLQVLCFLEYWSECHACYKTVAQFQLSESEMCYLDLPKSVPQPAVSCTWRVVLKFSNLTTNSELISDDYFVSPRALAACMRIDSYFNPLLVPRIQVAVNCFSINLSLYNQFNKKLALVMPEKLRYFTPDGLIPDNQCFLIFNAKYTKVFIACWCSNIAIIDFNTFLKCHVVDYSTLVMQRFIEPFSLMGTINLSEQININTLTENFKIKMNSSIGHTLAVSSQLWTQNWLINNNSEPPDMVVLTRYVVCNDTTIKLRFSQTNTEENILLPSRFLHLYCWRSQRYDRSIRVGIEQNGWIWSNPINIEKEKTELVEFPTNQRCSLIVTIKFLSATQKQVIFSGQLLICNMLLDQFECKVIPLNNQNKEKELKNAESHIINGKTTAPSILIDKNKKMVLRLRFLSLESAWSGDIPLEENTKCLQPWLVKVPLQERGQFLSIWCRIIDKISSKENKILVMLWPLFMVRSYLPVSTKVHIETRALNVSLETLIRGRGELQQLYCPGTIDHSHDLAFEVGTEVPIGSEPYIPLNYSLIDHELIFKKIDQESIDEILEYLKKYDESKWPYVDNSLEFTEWCSDDQPLTLIQVRYQSACQYASSLLVELLPWCLLINTLGVSIKILIKTTESCKVSHFGVITPPKLENTFNIGVEMNGSWYISPLLQLAKADWSTTFYMPKINGVIPSEGNIKIPIKCDLQMCMLSITSSIQNELRFLQISPCYIITNHTNLKLEAVCISVPNNNNNKTVDISQRPLTNIILEPHMDKSNTGIPITFWNCIEDFSETVTDFTFHIIICLNNKDAKSSPVKIDKNIIRKCVCLYSPYDNIPLVLITQEHKGIIYLSVHHDIHPQLLIRNNCTEQLICAQSDANGLPITENSLIKWTCTVYPDTETYYTMPTATDTFPNIDSLLPEKLIIAIKPSDLNAECQWSQEINITIFNEQYVRIPQYGDVKLLIKRIGSCVLIIIDSVTEVEISAQDIRSRLLLQASTTNSSINSESDSNKLIIKHKDKKNKNNTTTIDDYKSIIHEDNSEKFKSVLNTPKNPQDYSISSVDSDMLNTTSNINQWKALKNSCDSKQIPKNFNWSMVMKNVIFSMTMENEKNGFEKIEFTTFVCEYIGVSLQKEESIDCCVSLADIQCDNQLFNTGSFDFPVVLVGENSAKSKINFYNTPILDLIEQINNTAEITLDFRMEIWHDKNIKQNISEIQEMKVKFKTLSLYVEDTYISKLMEYLNNLLPTSLVMWSLPKDQKTINVNLGMIGVPEQVTWEAKIFSKPLYLKMLTMEPVSILLSLHSSVKLYIALDRSPLHFNKFERKNLVTTSYRLGHALTMHYLSDAIFGAGWVVGSLEILGSPNGLARSLGSGIRDFISLPYNGLIQGPWAFLVGITHGSASLMRHVTAGTLDSVTKLAASVARNLDRLTLDEEHVRRTEEMRRKKPQGIAQGFMQGLTGLGISLLGAVGGIAHHPLQSVMNEGPSTRGLVAGVGLGLVGVLTKPLSGAAELVALTGQGLLQGAGWNLLPEQRHQITTTNYAPDDSVLKYKWKFLQNTSISTNLIAIAEADFESKQIMLLLTVEAIIIINLQEDVIQKMISITEIHDIQYADPAEIRLSLVQAQRPMVQNTEPYEIEMDPVSRARVADYVKNSSGLVQMSPLGSYSNSEDGSRVQSQITTPVKFSVPQTPSLVFHVNPQIRNCLYDMLVFVKEQSQTNTFKIL